MKKNLEKLRYLKYLSLGHNEITNISGLNECINLQVLDLEHNKINDLSGLEGLRHLRCIYLSGNPGYEKIRDKVSYALTDEHGDEYINHETYIALLKEI